MAHVSTLRHKRQSFYLLCKRDSSFFIKTPIFDGACLLKKAGGLLL